MDYMFGGRRALVNLNLSGFDTHKVTNMNNMLYDCMELEQVNYGTKFVNDSLVYAAYMYKGAKNCNKPNWTKGTLKFSLYLGTVLCTENTLDRGYCL